MTDKPGKPHDPTDMSHPFYDPAKDPTHPFYEGTRRKRSDADSSDGNCIQGRARLSAE